MADTAEVSNGISQYLTGADIAKRLSMSKKNVYSLADRGILPASIRIGKARRWKLDDVKQALQTLEGGEKE